MRLPGAPDYSAAHYVSAVVHAIVPRRVRGIFDALSRGDYSLALDGLADDVHHVFAGDHPLGGERHSRDAVRRWFERLFRLYDLRFDVQRVLVDGPPWDLLVGIEWIAHATPRPESHTSTRAPTSSESAAAGSCTSMPARRHRLSLPDGSSHVGRPGETTALGARRQRRGDRLAPRTPRLSGVGRSHAPAGRAASALMNAAWTLTPDCPIVPLRVGPPRSCFADDGGVAHPRCAFRRARSDSGTRWRAGSPRPRCGGRQGPRSVLA